MSLSELRKRRGISQKELSDRLSVKQCTISKIETGKIKPSPELAMQLGEIFGLSSAEIWETFYATDTQVLLSP